MQEKVAKNFWEKPLGIVVIFIVFFYVMTFTVYYLYNPGPEERKQAEFDLERLQNPASMNTSQQTTATSQ